MNADSRGSTAGSGRGRAVICRPEYCQPARSGFGATGGGGGRLSPMLSS